MAKRKRATTRFTLELSIADNQRIEDALAELFGAYKAGRRKRAFVRAAAFKLVNEVMHSKGGTLTQIAAQVEEWYGKR